MLIRNMKTGRQLTVRVGDVEFCLLRISDGGAKIGIEAPKDMRIEFIDRETGAEIPFRQPAQQF